MNFLDSIQQNSQIDWIFGTALLAGFLIAFCTGASKLFNQNKSSIRRKTLAAIAPLKKPFIVSAFLYLPAAIIFGRAISETYTTKLINQDLSRTNLVINSFSTLAGNTNKQY